MGPARARSWSACSPISPSIPILLKSSTGPAFPDTAGRSGQRTGGLERSLAAGEIERADLRLVEAVERSETDLAMAIADGETGPNVGLDHSGGGACGVNSTSRHRSRRRFDLLVVARGLFKARRSKSSSAASVPFGNVARRSHELWAVMTFSGIRTVRFNG